MKLMNKKIIRIILVVFFVLLAATMVFGGRLLVVNQPLGEVDAIIVLGGGSKERIAHGVELFNKNYADTLIISGCSGANAYGVLRMRQTAMDMGVPDSSILLDALDGHNPGTGDQAITLRQMMQQYNFTSAIVVTSNYHTGRVRFIFDRAFKGTGIKLLVSHPEQSAFKPTSWWSSRANIRIFVFEIIKTAWYWLTFKGQ